MAGAISGSRIASVSTPPRFGAPRLAGVADAEAVHQLLWSAKDDIPLKETFNSPAYVEWVRNHCRARYFVVVAVRGTVAGVVLLKTKGLFYLAVGAPYRRLGIARGLIDYAKSRNDELSAKTRQQNARMIALLEREGFRCTTLLDSDPGWLQYRWRKHGD